MLKNFLSYYDSHSDLTVRFRSRALFKVDIVSIAFFGIFVIVNLIEKKYTNAFVELILVGCFIINLFLLKKGWYRTAVNMIIMICFLAGVMIILSSKTVSPYEGIMAFTYLMPTLVSLTLFGYSNVQCYLFLIFGEIFLLASLFLRALPAQVAPVNEVVALYVSPILLFVICNYFIVQVLKISGSVFGALKFQEEAASKRYQDLNILVDDFTLNLNLGNDLHDLATSTRDHAEQITERLTNMENIIGQLTRLMTSADEVQQEIYNAGKSVSTGMESQTTAISSSSAAIEEMAASINMISSTMKTRLEALNRLKESSSQSEKQIKESGRLMDEMLASNGQINAITAVIEDVGSQTNLLAMNASIEAAHAGEVGKGFAVVAGEIRKLAETTNSQSKQIRDLLEKSNLNSQSAVKQSREVLDHFELIMNQIDEQALAMQEVFNSLSELSANAREITGGVGVLRSANSSVNQSVKTMSSRIELGHGSVRKTTDMVHDVNELVARINEATDALVQDSRTLAEIGRKNTENQKKLETDLRLIR